MPANTSLVPASASNTRGLVGDVAGLLRELLPAVIAHRDAAVPIDHKRVIRPAEQPNNQFNFSINIEPYQGFRTWIAVDRELRGRLDISAIDEKIGSLQPELLGYVSHCSGSMIIQDSMSLLHMLSEVALSYVKAGDSLECSISRVVSELDALIRQEVATLEVVSPISGLVLPREIEEVDLGGGLLLRRLSAEEITEMASHDIMDQNRYDFMSRFVTTVLVARQETRIQLSLDHNNSLIDHAVTQGIHQRIEGFLSAVHLTKAGRIGVVANFETLLPSVLPGMKGRSTSPIIVNPPNIVELSIDDIETLTDNYKRLIACEREEIRIAAARLMDAESRFSPVDALLDSVIGLETLLMPRDSGELSFRISLNYAMLGDSVSHRDRYEDMKKIQETRGKVVHGSLNMKSSRAPLIFEHSELAKKCLRDVLKKFLSDPVLSGKRKLDSDFWLDKVIPPHEVAKKSK
jgi:hypothetical protein